MKIKLSEILDLVGLLDDSQTNNSSKDRFRGFLKSSIQEAGEIRDYVEECLRTTGDQYNRALQDLVNVIGNFMGFEVTFGRYRGVQGEIGFDGVWRSASGRTIVVEVKTSDTYAIKTSTLLGYIDELVSSRQIKDPDTALGLYVLGRPDPDLRQLEHAIIAEKRTHQLRTISVESLLSLAETMAEFDITHKDILDVIWPGGPSVDPFVDLITRVVAQRQSETTDQAPSETFTDAHDKAMFWLTPVKDHETETGSECVQKLVGKHRIYAFGERTPGRKHMKPGDWIAFYANGVGVVGHAKLVTSPERKPNSNVLEPDRFPYTVRLDSAEIYAGNPIIIDSGKRGELTAFQGRDPEKPWAWFVQGTRKVSESDFKTLTRSAKGKGA